MKCRELLAKFDLSGATTMHAAGVIVVYAQTVAPLALGVLGLIIAHTVVPQVIRLNIVTHSVTSPTAVSTCSTVTGEGSSWARWEAWSPKSRPRTPCPPVPGPI
jgi:hypothetical protein